MRRGEGQSGAGDISISAGRNGARHRLWYGGSVRACRYRCDHVRDDRA
jgi:hypothetical protein